MEVISGGAGYFGNPTITVSDSGGSGSGAQLNFINGGIDVYGQITATGIDIYDHGINYTNPVVQLCRIPLCCTNPSRYSRGTYKPPWGMSTHWISLIR